MSKILVLDNGSGATPYSGIEIASKALIQGVDPFEKVIFTASTDMTYADVYNTYHPKCKYKKSVLYVRADSDSLPQAINGKIYIFPSSYCIHMNTGILSGSQTYDNIASSTKTITQISNYYASNQTFSGLSSILSDGTINGDSSHYVCNAGNTVTIWEAPLDTELW